MKLNNIDLLGDFANDPRGRKYISHLNSLIDQLNERKLSPSIIRTIHEKLRILEGYRKAGSWKVLQRACREIQTLLEKEAKLVPRSFYQTEWMSLGMAIFGLPFGMILGLTLDLVYLSFGLPLGMAIGIAYGAGLDNKAKAEGRQLDLEVI